MSAESQCVSVVLLSCASSFQSLALAELIDWIGPEDFESPHVILL